MVGDAVASADGHRLGGFGVCRGAATPAAGLIAGVALAGTPVAALMFRYDNPDALLTFLMVVAGYCAEEAVNRCVRRLYEVRISGTVAIPAK